MRHIGHFAFDENTRWVHLVLGDDAPTVVIQNDLIRYLFADDPPIEDEWVRSRCSDNTPGREGVA